ncbi:hypothetical protein NDU88_012457 [Pleurodeles waltl]|uniref:Uncharacterized protein n=1 Tax=Pleurodeles waltl TaxID=8319 RepID=A0AAV7R0Q6_PLEWA|nr:hypothetical protein NDU88_012457 [Pleurodeles waltl]
MAAAAPLTEPILRRPPAWDQRSCWWVGGARSGSPLSLRVLTSQEHLANVLRRARDGVPPPGRWPPRLLEEADSSVAAPPGRSAALDVLLGGVGHTERIPPPLLDFGAPGAPCRYDTASPGRSA